MRLARLMHIYWHKFDDGVGVGDGRLAAAKD